MQSGISVSKELHEAFDELVAPRPVGTTGSAASPLARGIVVSIEKEQLVPRHVLPSRSADFSSDLAGLDSVLSDSEAAYVILRRDNGADASGSSSASASIGGDGGGTGSFVAATYVPDAAPVRQKTLFASTRLTLTRELGAERFGESLFATTRAELATPEGWARHDAHGGLAAPLTEEERVLGAVKEAEAAESRGTSARKGHVSSGLSFPVDGAALEALQQLGAGGDNLVQLRIDVPGERIELVSNSTTDAEGLAAAISEDEPRFSFFRHSLELDGEATAPIVFIYTCPSGSKIKERMVYASSRPGIIETASSEVGLDISKKLEATMPSEITASTIAAEFAPKTEEKRGFARPKRPGKR